MAQHGGTSGDALDAARAALAARDAELSAADQELTDAVAVAHAIASDAIRRLDRLGAQIEAAASGRVPDSPAAARELARFLVANQREMADIIAGAQAEIDAKIAVLQRLTERFRIPA
ncbi:MAG: DUF4226 domain-containing protein [Mycobacterium sp.]|nr:MAG: DUF4226 domain-containing protein [Mycobacterium sp.]